MDVIGYESYEVIVAISIESKYLCLEQLTLREASSFDDPTPWDYSEDALALAEQYLTRPPSKCSHREE